jgi:tetratricopeptide (TPR) repeat protein
MAIVVPSPVPKSLLGPPITDATWRSGHAFLSLNRLRLVDAQIIDIDRRLNVTENKKAGERKKALNMFEKALEINGPTGGRNLYSLVLTNLARNLRSRGRYEEAGVHLEKALAVAVESGYRITESNAQCILADIYARAGRETEAFASARRGLAIAREIGHRMLEGAALRVLGRHVQRLATIAHGDGVCTTCIPEVPEKKEQVIS